jgi:hypothetical protein
MYELKTVCLNLSDAMEALHNANHAIDYYGGHGDEEAMKKIFARMQFVRIALNAFDKKHGTKL